MLLVTFGERALRVFVFKQVEQYRKAFLFPYGLRVDSNATWQFDALANFEAHVGSSWSGP